MISQKLASLHRACINPPPACLVSQGHTIFKKRNASTPSTPFFSHSSSKSSCSKATLLARFVRKDLEPSAEDPWLHRSLTDPHVRIQRRILVAVPRSPDADVLLSWVSDNLARRGDTVECYHYAFGEASHADEHILSFTNGGFVAHDVHPPHSPDAALSRALEQWGRDLLEKHGRRLHESGVGISVHLCPVGLQVAGSTHVGHAVCKLADNMDADVLVMTTRHMQGTLTKWISGSDVDYVIKHSARPVVILHGGEGKPAAAAGGIELEMSAGRQLLVAVDSTPDSLIAVQWILQHMHRAADTIRLVHVVPCVDQSLYEVADGMVGPNTSPSIERAKHEKEKWIRSKIHVFEGLLRSAGAKYSTDILVEVANSPMAAISTALCRLATETEASVVLLTAHHHPLLTEAMLGSVSKDMAEHCKSPVVILKGHAVDSVQESRGVVE